TYFQSLIKDIDTITYHQQLPFFILPKATDEISFFEKNIIISSFAYPDPAGTKHLRVVINALHSFTDLEYLATCLESILVK
ncbi:MAG TPA: hypothetical protein PLA68_17610, partial [Panacibacter sp.]|nr:hypothetical protein [Panacibacter sp.]